MGRISMENLVATVEKKMEDAQMEAREKLTVLIKRAKTEDPLFFSIPFNPFNTEVPLPSYPHLT
jgi:hypothetical protein